MTVFEYDDRGRMTRQAEAGLNNRITITAIEYNFWDGVTKENTKSYKINSDGNVSAATEIEITKKYENQHTKQLTDALLIIKRDDVGTMYNDTITIQHPSYDDFGRVVGNDRSGTAADMQYAYDDMHGWLTQIHSDDLFDQRLYRETGSSHSLYNGNISAMTWTGPDEETAQRYDYTYDGVNRLTQAQYSQTAGTLYADSRLLNLIPRTSQTNVSNNYRELFSYDKNSNITALKRYGMLNNRSFGLIDDLTVEYNGNQKKRVEDAVTSTLTYVGASDFVDKSHTVSEYAYNANGSLKKDSNRGISSIEYDLLGNVNKVSFTNGSNIQYIYAADGRRLRTVHTDSGRTDAVIRSFSPSSAVIQLGSKDSIEYFGNLILKNGHPSQYLFDGGYVSFNADAYNGYHYYVQDYMGNVRIVVNGSGLIEQETHYYPYGGVIGDLSTNQNLQTYKFEGKELDRKFGLDWYDIHARQYDAIGVPSTLDTNVIQNNY